MRKNKKIILVTLIIFLIIIAVLFFVYSDYFFVKKATLRGYLEYPRHKVIAWLRTKSEYICIDDDALEQMDLSKYEGKFVEIKGYIDCRYKSRMRQVSCRCQLISIESIEEIQKERK